MKTWDYTDDIPLIPVRIIGKKTSVTSLALIDTGAKFCVLHEHLAQALGLERIGSEELRGFGGKAKFVVKILKAVFEIDEFRENVEVASVSDKHYPIVAPKVVLGRNLLNKFKITLDGRNRKIYVE